MLLRLIPDSPDPTILFNITFDNIPDHLPLPLHWANQHNALSIDDLELPRLTHSLDKAASLVSILDEVVFNVSDLVITCRFVDGSAEEWPLVDSKCLNMLQDVVQNVKDSAFHIGRIRDKDVEKERQEILHTPPTSLKRTHKKQRSFLKSFMVSMFTFSSSGQKQAPAVPPRPGTPPPPSPPPQLDPRIYRIRARSALVDIFRLFVQPEIRLRMPTGGYYTWILQSMLNRASSHMDQIVRSANFQVPVFLVNQCDLAATEAPGSVPRLLSPEEESELETDTDGSSLHTPSSNFSHFTFSSLSESGGPPFLSSQFDELAPEDRQECFALSEAYYRLHRLIVVANARQVHMDNDQQQREAVLEIRSRRRAWLNKSLVPGAVPRSMEAGLAMPFQSSRLAQCSWVGDDHEFVPNLRITKQICQARQCYMQHSNIWTQAIGEDNSYTFPISQDDFMSEDDHDDHGDWPMVATEDRTFYGAIRPRTRTRSMYAEQAILNCLAKSHSSMPLRSSILGTEKSYAYDDDVDIEDTFDSLVFDGHSLAVGIKEAHIAIQGGTFPESVGAPLIHP